jgi:hypothetical protein
MLKFTSVSGSVRAITDITLTGTLIRTGITPHLIIDPITGRTTGTVGIVIIAIITVILIITGASLTGIATRAGSKLFRASLIFLSGNSLRFGRTRPGGLFFLLWRSRRFGHRAFARLIDLEFFSQLLNKRGYFLLPLRFDLLPERLFDFSAFLNVPRFKLGALLWIELKTRVANRRVCVARNNLPSHVLPLTHEVALLRSHLHPNLGVAPEILPGIWRHREPAFPYALP